MTDLRFLSFVLSYSFVFLLVSSSPSGATAVAEPVFPIAKPGCNDTCGNVKIPYPFGIGPGCALNQSYEILCSSSPIRSEAPYIKFNSYPLVIEVMEVSLRQQTLTLSISKDLSCANQWLKSFSYVSRLDLTGTQFFFSKQFNKLMLLGCGNALLKQIDGSHTLSGCTSMCDPNISSTISNCYGINCCETSIPFDLSQYWVNFTISSPNVSYPCVSGFLVQQSWKPENYSDEKLPILFPYVPVVLSWLAPNLSYIDSISGCSAVNTVLELESGNVTNFQCECKTLGPVTWLYEINPYLDGACDDATSIINSLIGGGKKNTKVDIIVGISAGFGVLFLIVAIYLLYQVARKRRNKMRKQKFFERNGGLLLEQQVSSNEGVIDKTLIFTDKELIRATDGFNQNRILGQGGQGTVYKGMLSDGRIVAIKKSKKVDESQLGQFINEVVILSQVNHKNVVKLLGCCLETEVPMLVYEFIPNGTLHRLIHNRNADDIPFTWNLRLRIATEVAGALAYLHSAISIPIFHRDIKSSNLLLDEKYVARVSDFGTSMSVSIEKTHFTTLVKGTFGYLDPEYFQSSQFTEKSDVYSFGVVLVELLTGQKPISAIGTREDGTNLSLATRFLTSMDQDSLPTILDPQVIDKSNKEEVFSVAKLAQQCLNLNGKNRPTMKEVAIKLENIKLLSMHSSSQSNFQNHCSTGQEFSVISDKSIIPSTWTTGSESISLDLDAYPLLYNSV